MNPENFHSIFLCTTVVVSNVIKKVQITSSQIPDTERTPFFFFFFSRRFQEYPKILVSKAHYFICYTYFVILICSLSIFISSSFTITVFTLHIWMSQICVIASGSHVILQIILALCLSKSKILCQGSCHKIDLCSQKKKKNNVWRA